jgi:hypothetical protein
MTNEILKKLYINQKKINILIDSGAFTAWKQGLKIGLNDYCDLIKSLPYDNFLYFQLDVVGNPEATLHNYFEMKEKGFNPIPVFQRGSPIEYIEKYDSDYIALGSGVKTRKQLNYIKYFMNTKEIEGKKIHWLGYSGRDFLHYYKPYSCDVSSIHYGATVGRAEIFNGGRMIPFHSFRRKDYKGNSVKTIRIVNRHKNILKINIVNNQEFYLPENGFLLLVLMAYSSLKYQLYWKKLGINYYIAISGIGDLLALLEASKYI